MCGVVMHVIFMIYMFHYIYVDVCFCAEASKL